MMAAGERPEVAATDGRRPQGRVILEIRDLVKEFSGGRRALDGVSLAVRTGELLAVLGANGSGKSTLLRCAVRLLDPTAGSVWVDGRDLAHLSGKALRDARRRVAMIFQQANLVRRRTAVANVATGSLGRHHSLAVALGRLPPAELQFAAQLLERVGLAAIARQRADTLSGGQAQRVAIARALCQRPAALLADEPVASLDPEATEEIMLLLRDLVHHEALGVVCVLHQPGLALRHADRVVGLRDGRIAFDRPADQVDGAVIGALYQGGVASAACLAGATAPC